MDTEKKHVRIMTGVVTSNKMDKTVVVQVERRTKHPVYKRYVVEHNRFKAHDERNECEIGDTVVVKESRPLSKDKHWRVQKIVTKAVQA